jgi:carbonic anhydrase
MVDQNAYKQLLKNNKKWSEEIRRNDPDFFPTLAKLQTPKYLWIGCSDSRVPANEVTGTKPGEIFVHRNIANMVVHTDLNLLSVLQYAVEYLKVEHIIVCGHYGCGGVHAAMTNQSLGIINKWLRNIKDVYRIHKQEIDAIKDEKQRLDRMVELNVVEQVMDLAKTSIVQKAWIDRNAPMLHGWVYGLDNGMLKDLIALPPGSDQVDPIYRYDNLGVKEPAS